MTDTDITTTRRIAELNDLCRKSWHPNIDQAGAVRECRPACPSRNRLEAAGLLIYRAAPLPLARHHDIYPLEKEFRENS
jgi:hypothetical protein